MIGYNLAVSLLYRGIGVVVGMPVFIRYLKLSDYTMAIFGCVTTIIMFIGLAFATKLWMVFVGMFGLLGYSIMIKLQRAVWPGDKQS